MIKFVGLLWIGYQCSLAQEQEYLLMHLGHGQVQDRKRNNDEYAQRAF